jgi:hypothetical protein
MRYGPISNKFCTQVLSIARTPDSYVTTLRQATSLPAVSKQTYFLRQDSWEFFGRQDASRIWFIVADVLNKEVDDF